MYRTIPAHPDQWPGLVVKLDGEDAYAINTCNDFGLLSGGGVYGMVADAGLDIFRSRGMGPVSRWVDDHMFIRIRRTHLEEYNQQRRKWRKEIGANGGRIHERSRLWYKGRTMANGRAEEFDEDMEAELQDLAARRGATVDEEPFSYSDEDIERLSVVLGTVWEESETVHFRTTVPFLGFSWDLDRRTVSLLEEKQSKYLRAIQDWRSRRLHSLEQVQKLYGKLLHTSLVIPKGRAYLTKLEAMLGTFNNHPYAPHHAPQHTDDDLLWWERLLQGPPITRTISIPADPTEVHAYSDASSGWGIRITIGERWRAWRLRKGWKADGRDIGWAEAIGFELLVIAILQANRGQGDEKHIRVYGDNKGVVEGWWRGRSRSWRVNEVFRRIHELCEQSGATIHTRYVPSERNPADDPSRGIYPPRTKLLPYIPIPTDIRSFVTDFDSPDAETQDEVVPTPKPRREQSERRNPGDDQTDEWWQIERQAHIIR
jgi:hypothetical protein